MTTRFATLKHYPEPQDIDVKATKQEKQKHSTSSTRSSSVDSAFADCVHERTGSYSSVKEDRDGLPQSFIVSAKRTSLSRAIGGYDGCDDAVVASACAAESTVSRSKNASLGALPQELLEKIIDPLILDVPPSEYTPRNRDLMSCLLTSKALYAATVRILYRQVTFPHSNTFLKFMKRMRDDPELGRLVRRLDLSHFSSLGMNRTKQLNKEIQNLTSRSLLECLKAIPRVQEVLLQEHVDQDVDTNVLMKLFYGLNSLEALDLTASAVGEFAEAFSNAVAHLKKHPSLQVHVARLCLHECFTLKSDSLELLLSRLPNITVLDLHHTRVTDRALQSIPHSAKLTHLNIGRCPSLTADGLLDFLANHPAAAELVWLNVSCDTSRWRLFDEVDVTTLLAILPSTLRSLNLNGAKVQPHHIPALIPLTKHLEELALAHTGLSLDDICGLFPDFSSDTSDILPSTLHYLDLTALPTCTQTQLFRHVTELLGERSLPLEVIEVAPKIATALLKMKATNRSLGWTVKELGRRSWYVREGGAGDSGEREWKMGSRWWGMRKVPVTWSEVAGLYGHYMYKT